MQPDSHDKAASMQQLKDGPQGLTMDLPYVVNRHNSWFSMTRYKNFVCEFSLKAHHPPLADQKIVTNQAAGKGAKYFVDDHVYITNDTVIKRQADDRKQLDYWVAKILEIRASDQNHVYVRIYWMYSPEDLPRTAYNCDDRRRQLGHSYGQNELIASNHSKLCINPHLITC